MLQYFKNLFFTLVNFFSSGLRDKASILMYHSVSTNEAFFSVTKETFEQQIEYLRSRKIIFVKLSELVERMRTRKSIAGCVSITFDDGYKDNFMNAYPILKKYNIPSTIFLTTGSVGGVLALKSGIVMPVLSVQEINEMRSANLTEFFPHSVTHVKYNGENLEQCAGESMASKQRLEQLVGGDISIYAYPSGRFDASLVGALREQGYHAAVTVEGGLISADDDLFTLKRNAVDSLTTMTQFKGKASGGIEAYIWLKNIFQ